MASGATVGCVYDLEPVARAPGDILADSRAKTSPAPKAKNKWLMASVVEDAGVVVSRIFEEAERRDPEGRRTWVALVDGNNHQIELIGAAARHRGRKVTIVVDFIHVLEYLWKAAWSFFAEADPQAEIWVRRKALSVLQGGAGRVSSAIQRMLTEREVSPEKREGAQDAARYLTRKRKYLDYPTALGAGWPISTGVIEGAVRYLVNDRMAITGARWGLEGAEAVLKLRTLRTNGDFNAYWRFHLDRERRLRHAALYRNQRIPGS